MNSEETYYSRLDLSYNLSKVLNPVDLLKVLSAYDIADSITQNSNNQNALNQFHKASRISRIIIKDLKNHEPDVIIASLLFNIFEFSNEITPEIIEFNFGNYVTYLVAGVHNELKILKSGLPEISGNFKGNADILLLILAECLDSLKYNDFGLIFTPLAFIQKIADRYFIIGETSDDKNINELIEKIKDYKNKLLS